LRQQEDNSQAQQQPPAEEINKEEIKATPVSKAKVYPVVSL